MIKAKQLFSFISPASLGQLPHDSVAVCAHDAGAASHMAAWLSAYKAQIRPCLKGPALNLFENQFGPLLQYSLEDSMENARLLISGTGWSTDLEHNSRLLARQRGIPIIAVLDHWVNYRSRFNFMGAEVLPDQLWVADLDAKALAQQDFPEVPVLQLPNQWLNDLTQSVVNLRFNPPKKPAQRLLYLLEPILAPWSGGPWDEDDGEIQGVRFWLEKLPLLAQRGFITPLDQGDELILRPHPSDPLGKYDALIAEARCHLPIRLDCSPMLATSLAWADIAFGCETQALVAALACGIPAFSTIPPWAPPCRLPQDTLYHLSQL